MLWHWFSGYTCKIKNFTNDIKKSAEYKTFIDEKSAEYSEQLYHKEISNEEFILKINDLEMPSTFKGYLKDNGTPAQIARYEKFEHKEKLHTLMVAISVPIVALAGVGILGTYFNALKKDEKYFKELEPEIIAEESTQTIPFEITLSEAEREYGEVRIGDEQFDMFDEIDK